jgi:hypothetical protein
MIMTELGPAETDVYGAVVLVNVADGAYRIAMTAESLTSGGYWETCRSCDDGSR